MTREEALKVLDTIPTIGEQVDALEMAIKALEQEPCEDAISRQAAIDGIADLKKSPWFNDDTTEAKVIRKEAVEIIEDLCIKSLPSVTPQPKVGKWLEKEVISDKVIEEWQSAKCSKCNLYHTTPYMYYFSNYKFCPNCGARMEVENDKDDDCMFGDYMSPIV